MRMIAGAIVVLSGTIGLCTGAVLEGSNAWPGRLIVGGAGMLLVGAAVFLAALWNEGAKRE